MSSDQHLVNDFLKTRSERSFTAIYRDKTPHLYQMALRLTSFDEHKAEELIQQMWVTAIRNLEGFQWKSELKTWLTGILINLNRQSYRNPDRQHDHSESIGFTPSIHPPNCNTYDLERALGILPVGYRTVIILHDIEGYTHKEIAALLNTKEGTSKSQLFHARKALRDHLKKIEMI